MSSRGVRASAVRNPLCEAACAVAPAGTSMSVINRPSRSKRDVANVRDGVFQRIGSDVTGWGRYWDVPIGFPAVSRSSANWRCTSFTTASGMGT